MTFFDEIKVVSFFDEMMVVCRMCERKNTLCTHIGCYDENDKACEVVISNENIKGENNNGKNI